MDLLKNIASPLRKTHLQIYSSRRHLIEEDTEISGSEDVISSTPKNIFLKSSNENSVTEDIPLKVIKSNISYKNEIKKKTKKPDTDVHVSSSFEHFPKQHSPTQKNEILSLHANSKTNLLNDSDIEGDVSDQKKDSPNDKKPKEKKRKPKNIKDVIEIQPQTNNNKIKAKTTEERIKKNIECKLDIIGVHIIDGGLLKNHLFIRNAIIKMHVFDQSTENVKLIKTSRPFNFSKNRTILPQWNELMFFEKDFIKNVCDIEQLLIIFEIIDLKTADNKSSEVRGDCETIAWAFLKPFNLGKPQNINMKVKLQLYQAIKIEQGNSLNIVYERWKCKKWKAYPSVLNVILKAVKVNDTHEIANLLFFQDIHKSPKTGIFDSNFIYEKRTQNQPCEIPNTIGKSIYNIENGSIMIKFSHCGNYLACATYKNKMNVIIIYKVPDFTEIAQLSNHRNLIYDICWSTSKNVLITASADCTACVWDISLKNKALLHVLTHSAFVYCAKFCHLNENVVVTGSYDKMVRIWMNNEINYNLCQELPGHEGFVNAICFLKNSKLFFSGDSSGIIIKWGNDKNNWFKIGTIKINEIMGKIINDLVIFPDNLRILIVLRNSNSWSFDIPTSAVFTCFISRIKLRYQVRGSISPCGLLVFIGNCIWAVPTGQLLTIYNPTQFDHQNIMGIDYHPNYNLVAVGCGFKNTPLLLCHYKKNFINDIDLGMEIFSSINPLHKKQDNEDKPTLNDYKKEMYKLVLSKPAYLSSLNNSRDVSDSKAFKLWKLLSRMDDIILIAKNGQRHCNKTQLLENELIKYSSKGNKNGSQGEGSSLKNAITDSESSKNVISVDLTAFYNMMKQNQCFDNADLTSNKQSASSNPRTYTIEDKPKTDFNHDNISNVDVGFVDEQSSTLSNAESLENDLLTYTIPFDSENKAQ